MTRISNSFEPGDKLCIAWIESGTCYDAYFEVDTIGTDSTEYDLKLSNDIRDVHLLEGPCGLLVLVDPTVDENSRRAFPVLGISDCAYGLAWDIILTMLKLDYSAEDAINLVALGFEFACPDGFSRIRGTQLDDLRARVDDIIEMIENPAGTEVAS